MPLSGEFPTPYPALNAVLEDLVGGARSALAESFVGAYLQGCAAMLIGTLNRANIGPNTGEPDGTNFVALPRTPPATKFLGAAADFATRIYATLGGVLGLRDWLPSVDAGQRVSVAWRP